MKPDAGITINLRAVVLPWGTAENAFTAGGKNTVSATSSLGMTSPRGSPNT